MAAEKDRIRELINDIKRDELYFYNDNRCFDFVKANAKNTELLIIEEKISAINRGLLEVHDLSAMARHILSIAPDQKLRDGDLDLVGEIASLDGPARHDLLNFASTYCNFHRPEIYPIQSPVTEGLMRLFAGKKEGEIRSYTDFVQITGEFMDTYDFDSFTFYELEKCLWLKAADFRAIFNGRD